jgi:hypothetical protein
MITYGVGLGYFCTIGILERRAMPMKVYKSFGEKKFEGQKLIFHCGIVMNFSFVLVKQMSHLIVSKL